MGLEAALPRLVTLTGLALDHAELVNLPSELTLLQSLRLLSLHGSFAHNLEVRAGSAAL